MVNSEDEKISARRTRHDYHRLFPDKAVPVNNDIQILYGNLVIEMIYIKKMVSRNEEEDL